MARNDVTIKVGADTISAEKAFGKLKSGVLGFTAGLVGTIGLTAALTGSTVEASRFETAMAEVSTLLDDTSGLEKTSKEVRAIAKEFGTAPTAQAKALYQIISSGASEAGRETELLTAANKLAVGGITDVETAAGGLTNIIKGFNLEQSEAGRVSDVLFASMRAGKTTIGELAANFGNVGSFANAAGISLEETAAAIATLTTQGISTSQAVTQMSGVLQAVVKPTGEAAEYAKKLGIEFNAEALASKGLAGFLADVAEKTGGSTEATSKLFGGVEGLKGVLSLAGTQAKDFAATMDTVTESTGQTDIAVDKVTKTSEFQAKRFKAVVIDIGVSLGNIITAFSPVLEEVGKVIEGFDDTGTAAEDMARRVNEAAENVGPALESLIGGIQTFAGGAKVTFNLLQIAVQSVGAVVTEVASQVLSALSLVTLGPISDDFKKHADLMRQTSYDLQVDIDKNLLDIAEGGELAAGGLNRITEALSESGKAAEAAKPKIETLVISQEEYEGVVQGAAEETENLTQKQNEASDASERQQQVQSGVTEEIKGTTDASIDLTKAYDLLGFKSSGYLKTQAADLRVAYDLLVAQGEPIEDQKRAWLRVAAAELEAAKAAGEVEFRAKQASLQAQAAANGQSDAFRELAESFSIAGAASDDFGDRAVGNLRRATRAAKEAAAEIEATFSATGSASRSQYLNDNYSTGGVSSGTTTFLQDLSEYTDEQLDAWEEQVMSAAQANASRPGRGTGRISTDYQLEDIERERARRMSGGYGDVAGRNASTGEIVTREQADAFRTPSKTINLKFQSPDGSIGQATLLDDDGAANFLNQLARAGTLS